MRTALSSSFHMAGTGVSSPSDTRYTCAWYRRRPSENENKGKEFILACGSSRCRSYSGTQPLVVLVREWGLLRQFSSGPSSPYT